MTPLRCFVLCRTLSHFVALQVVVTKWYSSVTHTLGMLNDYGTNTSIPNYKEVLRNDRDCRKIKSELSRLSLQERAELAYFLIHSLDEEVNADAEAAWDAELAQRLEEIKSGKAVGEPADKVFAEIREKYS